MTYRLLFALMVLFWFAEATPPAGAFPVPAMKPTAFPAIADIRMACAGSTAIKGSATTQDSEAATKTSPMAKTDP